MTGDELAEVERLIETDPANALTKASSIAGARPGDPDAYRVLGSALRRLGRVEEAELAEFSSIRASAADPQIARAGQALQTGDLPTAEAILRAVLSRRPNDVAATRMLGEVAAEMGAFRDSEALYRRALELAPAFDYARLNLANLLYRHSRPAEAIAELDRMGKTFAEYPEARTLRASALGQLGEYQRAIDLYRGLVEEDPADIEAWTSLAFLLKTVGEPDQAVEACRSALKAAPANGEAWWMLADMKSYRFSAADVAALEAAIADPATGNDDRQRLHMALGKALEDRKDYDASFEHYRAGNALRAAQLPYDPARTGDVVDRMEQLFTAGFLASRDGGGDPAPDPIFIVGLPRSGSTLVEQILASHPLIEGTGELSDIHLLAKSLEPGPRYRGPWEAYPDVLAELPSERLAELGRQYVDRTRVQRKTDRPLFIDKMPNNWLHVGFIRLILPNATIIDARRHPLACGFSNFKQLYARGHEFSYDLAHIGQHYGQYVRLMTHFDRVVPGGVLRVIHEDLVADPEQQIRRLLDHVGVPFDEACLRFHETRRSVRSASAEQVRRPIQSDATEQWRAYESHLGPLKAALGPVLEDWRGEA
ncbi:MAG: tetratricopeptide repeat-containing sulfotransferase family protein [Sphingomicrobium sp.]